MPFIKGRYHINPIVGAALEAAREADEAAASRQQSPHDDDSEKPASSPADQKAVRFIASKSRRRKLCQHIREPRNGGSSRGSIVAVISRKAARMRSFQAPRVLPACKRLEDTRPHQAGVESRTRRKHTCSPITAIWPIFCAANSNEIASGKAALWPPSHKHTEKRSADRRKRLLAQAL